MFTKILVAVDGSPASFHAATFASRLAEGLQSELHLICMVDKLNPPLVTALPMVESPAERCDIALTSAQAAIGRRATVRSKVVGEGAALQGVLERAQEMSADLLCVGSGKSRIKLGSLSSALIRRAAIPVAVLREGILSTVRIAGILVGVDGSESSLHAARIALPLSQRLGASLSLASVLPASARIGAGGVEMETEEASPFMDTEGGRAMRDIANEAEEMGTKLRSACLLSGDPSERLLLHAKALRADVLIVGAGRLAPLRGLLGSVASRLASQSSLPLLVVR